MSDRSSASAKEVYSCLTVGSNPRNPQDVREDHLTRPTKRLSYNSFKSNIGKYSKDIQLFPLELRPVLENEERKACSFYNELLARKQHQQQQRMEEDSRCRSECSKRHRVPRRQRVWDECPCVERNNFNCGHDVYRNILGPTPDESILAGLQTVIDIMGLSDLIPSESQSLWSSSKGSTTSSWRCTSPGSSQEELTYPMTIPRRAYTDRKVCRPVPRTCREPFERQHRRTSLNTSTNTPENVPSTSQPQIPACPCPSKDSHLGQQWSLQEVAEHRQYRPCHDDTPSYRRCPLAPPCADNPCKQNRGPSNKVAVYETALRENVPECNCSQAYQKPQKALLANKHEPLRDIKELSDETLSQSRRQISNVSFNEPDISPFPQQDEKTHSTFMEAKNGAERTIKTLSEAQLHFHDPDIESYPHPESNNISYHMGANDENVPSTPDNSTEVLSVAYEDPQASNLFNKDGGDVQSLDKISVDIALVPQVNYSLDKFRPFHEIPTEVHQTLVRHKPPVIMHNSPVHHQTQAEILSEEKSVHSVVEVKTQGVQIMVEQMNEAIEVNIESEYLHGVTKKKKYDDMEDDETEFDETDEEERMNKRRKHKREEMRRKSYLPTLSIDMADPQLEDKQCSCDEDKHSMYSQVEKVAVGDCGCKIPHPPKELYDPSHLLEHIQKPAALTYYEMCIQTDDYCPPVCTQRQCMKDECCGPDKPPSQVKTKHGHPVCIKYRQRTESKDLTAQTFPPINLPSAEACGPSTCDCPFGECLCSPCNCSAAESSNSVKKSVLVRDPMHKHSTSSHLFQHQLCNKEYVPPENKWKMNFRGSGLTVPPVVQPVIGICQEGKCGHEDKVEEVRYAMVRISIFNEYTTYEVLKSSTEKPKKMPPVVEGIFVTKN